MPRRKKTGDIYRFDFDEKYHCYCQILNSDDVVFFDYYSDHEADDIDEVVNSKELFVIYCDQDCFKGPKWKFIENKEPAEERKIPRPRFHKDIGDGHYSIYKDFVLTKCNREDCFGLEIFSLWTEYGITQRLNYSFFNIELSPYDKADLPFYE